MKGREELLARIVSLEDELYTARQDNEELQYKLDAVVCKFGSLADWLEKLTASIAENTRELEVSTRDLNVDNRGREVKIASLEAKITSQGEELDVAREDIEELQYNVESADCSVGSLDSWLEKVTAELDKYARGREVKKLNKAKTHELLSSYRKQYEKFVEFLAERNQTSTYTESKPARHFIVKEIRERHGVEIEPDGKLARARFPVIK